MLPSGMGHRRWGCECAGWFSWGGRIVRGSVLIRCGWDNGGTYSYRRWWSMFSFSAFLLYCFYQNWALPLNANVIHRDCIVHNIQKSRSMENDHNSHTYVEDPAVYVWIRWIMDTPRQQSMHVYNLQVRTFLVFKMLKLPKLDLNGRRVLLREM